MEVVEIESGNCSEILCRADETKNLLNDTESVGDVKDVYDILYLPGMRTLFPSFRLSSPAIQI